MSNQVKTRKPRRTGTGRPQPAAEKRAQKAAQKQPASKSGSVAKADGRPAVEAWMDRVKPELQPIVRRLDQLILEAMPDVVFAIKWNVPFYGLRGQGWIVSVNSFKAHVKLLFFSGSALKPKLPTGKGNIAIDFHSNEELDQNEKQVKAWLQQAKKLPGWLRL